MRFRKVRNSHTLYALCGTSTKVAAGALGFRIECDDSPERMSTHRGQVYGVVDLDAPQGGREGGKDPEIISPNHRGDGQIATEPFGPLKVALESISAVYARYEVFRATPPKPFLH